MAAPEPFHRFPPSGPRTPAGSGAILQWDTRVTLDGGETPGPTIPVGPGIEFPVAGGIPPRIGRPRVVNGGSRLLIEFGCSLQLVAWDGVPTIGAQMQISQNEGTLWQTLALPVYSFPPIADTGGDPALQTQKVWMRGQVQVSTLAIFGPDPGPTVIGRVLLLASAASPAAAIYAAQGEAYLSLYEMEGATAVPAP